MSTSVICPGQRALFRDENAGHYLRAVFTVYWQGSSPSTEVFYLHNYPLSLSLAGIEGLEKDALALLQSTVGHKALRVIFISFGGIEMAPTEFEAPGLRTLTAPPAAKDAAV